MRHKVLAMERGEAGVLLLTAVFLWARKLLWGEEKVGPLQWVAQRQ